MDAYFGEIRAFPFSFTPEYWLECDGTAYQIGSYQALYAVIGTTYGGDGKTNFKVPDLRGLAAMHIGQGPGSSNYTLSQTSGVDTVTLTETQMPNHDHSLQTQVSTTRLTAPSNQALLGAPVYKTSAGSWAYPTFVPATTSPTLVPMSPFSLYAAGSSGAHNNRQPWLAFRFCICWNGTWPENPN